MPVPDCPPGWTRAGGVCQAPPPPPVESKQCPDGSNIPVTQDCPRQQVVSTEPFIVLFDWDRGGITMAFASVRCPPGWTRDGDGVCQAPPPPVEARQCPDGSFIPVGQQCPRHVAFSDPFILFFDWDEDGITPAAAAILDNAAAGYRQLGSAPVVVAAHTDRSGSDHYNLLLSQRRAGNVRDYLARRGVPGDAITVESYGETRPLVDTADGVREPQNRRVEITFGPGR